jgi:heme a synthase
MGYRLPLVTTISIFLLLLAGSLVVNFDAGLACPDWPLCNGKVIPPLEGKVVIEYSHRLLTTAVSLLIFVNVFVAWRKRKQNALPFKLSLLAVVLLILVAASGAINVMLKLPAGFTAIDVSEGMLLFATYVVLTAVTLADHLKKQNKFHPAKLVKAIYKPALVATIATFLEIVLGTFFEHSKAGKIWIGEEYRLLNHVISSKEIAAAVGYTHMFTTFIVCGTILYVFFHSVQKKVLKGTSSTLIALLVLQTLAGFAAIMTKLSITSEMAHLALAALTLAGCVFLTAQAKFGVDLLARSPKMSVVPAKKQRTHLKAN